MFLDDISSLLAITIFYLHSHALIVEKCCRLSLASKCHHMFLSSGENSRRSRSVYGLGATAPPFVFVFYFFAHNSPLLKISNESLQPKNATTKKK